MLEVFRVLMHLHSRRFSASRRFPVRPRLLLRHNHGGYVLAMEGIQRDGIWRWYVNGELVEEDDDAYVNGGFGGVPASEEAMAALPETTVQSEGEIMGEKECAVCLEAYEAGDKMRTLPCSHGFHERCIFRWLRVSRLCPLCRSALPAAAEETKSFMGQDGGEEEQSAYDL